MSALPGTLALMLPEDPGWCNGRATDLCALESPERIAEELLVAERNVLRLEAEEAHLKKSGAGEGELLSEVRTELQSEYLRVIRLRRESVSLKPDFQLDAHKLDTFQENVEFDLDTCSPRSEAHAQLEIETRLESQRRESQAALLASLQPLVITLRRERGSAASQRRAPPATERPKSPPQRSTDAASTARWNCTPFTALSTPKQSPRTEVNLEPSSVQGRPDSRRPQPPRSQRSALASTSAAVRLLLQSTVKRALFSLTVGAWRLAVVIGRREHMLELELAALGQPRQSFSRSMLGETQVVAASCIVSRLWQHEVSAFLSSIFIRWRLILMQLRTEVYDTTADRLQASAGSRTQAAITLQERYWRQCVTRIAMKQWHVVAQQWPTHNHLQLHGDDPGRGLICISQVFGLWRLVIRWASAERRVNALRARLCDSQVRCLQVHMRLQHEDSRHLAARVISVWMHYVNAGRASKSALQPQGWSSSLIGQNSAVQKLAQCAAFKIWEQHTRYSRASSVEAARIDCLHRALGDAEGRLTRFADACGHCCMKAWNSTDVPLAWSLWKSWTKGQKQMQAAAKKRQGLAGSRVAGTCWSAWRHAASRTVLRNGRARRAGQLRSTLERAALQGCHAASLLAFAAWKTHWQSEQLADEAHAQVRKFHAEFRQRATQSACHYAELQDSSLLAMTLRSWRHEVELQKHRLQVHRGNIQRERVQLQFAHQSLWVSRVLFKQLLRLVLCAWVGAAVLTQAGRSEVTCATAVEAQRISRARLKVWLRQRVARSQFASILDILRVILTSWWREANIIREQHLARRVAVEVEGRKSAEARLRSWLQWQPDFAEAEENLLLVFRALLAWDQAVVSSRKEDMKAQHSRSTQHLHNLLLCREDRASHGDSFSLPGLILISWQWTVAESRIRWQGACRVAELQTRVSSWIGQYCSCQLGVPIHHAAFLVWSRAVAVMQRQQLVAGSADFAEAAVQTRLREWSRFQEAQEARGSAMQLTSIVLLVWLHVVMLARQDASSLLREAEAIARSTANTQLIKQRRRASLRAAEWASLGHAASLKAAVLVAWVHEMACSRGHLAARQRVEAHCEAQAWLDEVLRCHMLRADTMIVESLLAWMFSFWARASAVSRREFLELQMAADMAVAHAAQVKLAHVRQQSCRFLVTREAAAEVTLISKVFLAWLHGSAAEALARMSSQRMLDAARDREAENRFAQLLSRRAVRASQAQAEACLPAVFALWRGLHELLQAQKRSEQSVVEAFTRACLMTEERLSRWSAFHDQQAAKSATVQMLSLAFLVWLHSSTLAREEAGLFSSELEAASRRTLDAVLRERRSCALAQAAQRLRVREVMMLLAGVLTAWLQSTIHAKAVHVAEARLLRLEAQQHLQAAYAANVEVLRLAGTAFLVWLSASAAAALQHSQDRQLSEAWACQTAQARLAACLSRFTWHMGAAHRLDCMHWIFVTWREHHLAEYNAKVAAETQARRESNQQLKVGFEIHAERAVARATLIILESAFARWSWAVLSVCVQKCKAQIGAEVSTRHSLEGRLSDRAQQYAARAASDRAGQVLGAVLLLWLRITTSVRERRSSMEHVALAQAATDARTAAEVQLSRWWHCYAVQAEIYEKVGRLGVAFVAWLRAIALGRKYLLDTHGLQVITWLCHQSARNQAAEHRWILASVISAWARAAACEMEDRMYQRSLTEAESRRGAEARLDEWLHHLAVWADVAETRHHLEASFAAWFRALLLAQDERRHQESASRIAQEVHYRYTVHAKMSTWLVNQALLMAMAQAADSLRSAFAMWRLCTAVGRKRSMEYARIQVKKQQDLQISWTDSMASRCNLHAALAMWCCATAVGVEERHQLARRNATNGGHIKRHAFMMWLCHACMAREEKLCAQFGEYVAKQRDATFQVANKLDQHVAAAQGVQDVCLLHVVFSAWLRSAAAARDARLLSWRMAEREANTASLEWLKSQVCRKALQVCAAEEAMLLSFVLFGWWRSTAIKREHNASACLWKTALRASASAAAFLVRTVFVEWVRFAASALGASELVRSHAGSSIATCHSSGNRDQAAGLRALVAAWGRVAASARRERIEQRSAAESAAAALAWAQAADLEVSMEEARTAEAQAQAQAEALRHRAAIHSRETQELGRALLCMQVFTAWHSAALKLRLEGELTELELHRVAMNQGSEMAAEHMVDATIAREQALLAENAAEVRFFQVAGAEARLSHARAEACAQLEALRLSFHAQGCALAVRRMATSQQRAFLAWAVMLANRIHKQRLEQQRLRRLQGSVFCAWRSLRQVAAVERRYAMLASISVLEQAQRVQVSAFLAWCSEVSAARHVRATGSLAEQLAEAGRHIVQLDCARDLTSSQLSRLSALWRKQAAHLLDACSLRSVQAVWVAWRLEARHACMHIRFAEEAAISSSGRAAGLAGAIAEMVDRRARASWISRGVFIAWLTSVDKSRTLHQADVDSLQRTEMMKRSIERVERCKLLAAAVHEWCAQVQAARAEHWLQTLESEHHAALEDSNLQRDHQLEAVSTKHQVAQEEVVLQHGQQLNALNDEHYQRIEALKVEHQLALEEAAAHYDQQFNLVQAEKQRSLEVQKAEQQCHLQERSRLTQQLDIQRLALQTARQQQLKLQATEARLLSQNTAWALMAALAAWRSAVQLNKHLLRITRCYSENDRMLLLTAIQIWQLRTNYAHQLRAQDQMNNFAFDSGSRLHQLNAFFSAWACWKRMQTLKAQHQEALCQQQEQLATAIAEHQTATQQITQLATNRAEERDWMAQQLEVHARALQRRQLSLAASEDVFAAHCANWTQFAAWVVWRTACMQSSQKLGYMIRIHEMTGTLVCRQTRKELHAVFCFWWTQATYQQQLRKRAHAVEVCQAAAVEHQPIVVAFCWWSSGTKSRRILRCIAAKLQASREYGISALFVAFRAWHLCGKHRQTFQQQLRKRAHGFDVIQAAAVEHQLILMAFCWWSFGMKSRRLLRCIAAKLEASQEYGISALSVAFRAWRLCGKHRQFLHNLNQERGISSLRIAFRLWFLSAEHARCFHAWNEVASRRCLNSRSHTQLMAAFCHWMATARINALDAEYQGVLQLTEFRHEQRLQALAADFQVAAVQAEARHEQHVGEMRAEQRQGLQQRILQHEQRIKEMQAQANNLRRVKRQSVQLQVSETVFDAKLSWWALMAAWIAWRALLQSVQVSCRATMHAAEIGICLKRINACIDARAAKSVHSRLASSFRMWGLHTRHVHHWQNLADAFEVMQFAVAMRGKLDQCFRCWRLLARSSRHMHLQTWRLNALWAATRTRSRLAPLFHIWVLLKRHANIQQRQCFALRRSFDMALVRRHMCTWQCNISPSSRQHAQKLRAYTCHRFRQQVLRREAIEAWHMVPFMFSAWGRYAGSITQDTRKAKENLMLRCQEVWFVKARVRNMLVAVCRAWQRYYNMEQARKYSARASKVSGLLHSNISRVNAAKEASVVQAICIAWQGHCRSMREQKRAVTAGRLSAQLKSYVARIEVIKATSISQIAFNGWLKYHESEQAQKCVARVSRFSAQLDRHIARADAAEASSLIQVVCMAWRECHAVEKAKRRAARISRLRAQLDSYIARSNAVEAMSIVQIICTAWHEFCEVMRAQKLSARVNRLNAQREQRARAGAAEIIQAASVSKSGPAQNQRHAGECTARLNVQLDRHIARAEAAETVSILQAVCTAWHEYCQIEHTRKRSAEVIRLAAQLDRHIARADAAEAMSIASAALIGWQSYYEIERVRKRSSRVTQVSAQLDRHVARANVAEAMSLVQAVCFAWQEYCKIKPLQKCSVRVDRLSAQLDCNVERAAAKEITFLALIVCRTWHLCCKLERAQKLSTRTGRLRAQSDHHIARANIAAAMAVLLAAWQAWQKYHDAEQAQQRSVRFRAHLDCYIASASAVEAMSIARVAFAIWASSSRAGSKQRQQQLIAQTAPAAIAGVLEKTLAAWVLLTVAQRAAKGCADMVAARARLSKWLKLHVTRASHSTVLVVFTVWSAVTVASTSKARVLLRQSELLMKRTLQNSLIVVLATWKHGTACGRLAAAGDLLKDELLATSPLHETDVDSQGGMQFDNSGEQSLQQPGVGLSERQLMGMQQKYSGAASRKQGMSEGAYESGSFVAHGAHKAGSLSEQQLAELRWACDAGIDLDNLLAEGQEHSIGGGQHWSMTEGSEYGEDDHGLHSHDSHFGLSDQQLQLLSDLEVLHGSPVHQSEDQPSSVGSHRRVSFCLDDAAQSEPQLFSMSQSEKVRRVAEIMDAHGDEIRLVSSSSQHIIPERVRRHSASVQTENHGIGSGFRSGQLQRFAAHVQALTEARLFQVTLAAWAQLTRIRVRLHRSSQRAETLLEGSAKGLVCMRVQMLMIYWHAQATLSCTLREAGIFRNELGGQVLRLTFGVRLALMFTVWRCMSTSTPGTWQRRGHSADHAITCCSTIMAQREERQLSAFVFLCWRLLMAPSINLEATGTVGLGDEPPCSEAQDAMQARLQQLEEEHAAALHQVAVLEMRCAAADQWRDNCAVDDEEALRLARVIDKQLRLAGQEMEMASQAEF